MVVVGSGWSSHAFLKRCETDAYEVICVSPRPYFLFTPMLAFATVGGVTTGSIVEPIRAANPGANYVEGEMTDVNVIDKNIRVSCCHFTPFVPTPFIVTSFIPTITHYHTSSHLAPSHHTTT